MRRILKEGHIFLEDNLNTISAKSLNKEPTMNRFLVQVNTDGGYANIMQNRLYKNEHWMNKPRDRDHGEVEPGDELVIYCTSKVPSYGMSLAFCVTVENVSTDKVTFSLGEPRWFKSPLKRDAIIDMADKKALPDIFRKCGQQGFNIAKLDPSSSEHILGILNGGRQFNNNGVEQNLDTAKSARRDQGSYTVKAIIRDGCFLSEASLLAFLGRLRSKKNIILQGPPGTGKTWLAKRLAFALIGSQSECQVRTVQFHPNTSYEDFVRGWRPGENGALELSDGPFLTTMEDARVNPSMDYVFVIEEINRGNPAQIFGEMLTLLESDKRFPQEALALSYPKNPSERVFIPPNIHVIGTMNLADRSLALVDFALRRRFAFIDLEPTFGERWRTWVSEQAGIEVAFLRIVEERLSELNQTISEDRTLGPQFRIGHSFVTPTPGTSVDDPHEWFTQIVETEIGPHLDECWFEDLDRARTEKQRLLQDLNS